MTVQIQDSLSLEGTPASLACDMEIAEHPRIRKLSDEEAFESCGWAFSTNCHRHFLASWAILDGRLHLIGVEGIYELIGDEPLFAGWYCGTLCVPTGKKVRRPAFGYSSTHERELYIEVKDGLVIRQWEERNDFSKLIADPGADVPSFLRNPIS